MLDGAACATPTTDRPLDMQTKATIHTDSLVPGVFAQPVRVHDMADAHVLAPTVADTTEPEPLADVHAERARRALEDAWAADWGRPWMTAIWRAAAAEVAGGTRADAADRLTELDRVVALGDRRSKKE
jgi:hypothetical protein